MGERLVVVVLMAVSIHEEVWARFRGRRRGEVRVTLVEACGREAQQTAHAFFLHTPLDESA
eukprot:9472314-Pyramimonas_sp.AAC.1